MLPKARVIGTVRSPTLTNPSATVAPTCAMRWASSGRKRPAPGADSSALWSNVSSSKGTAAPSRLTSTARQSPACARMSCWPVAIMTTAAEPTSESLLRCDLIACCRKSASVRRKASLSASCMSGKCELLRMLACRRSAQCSCQTAGATVSAFERGRRGAGEQRMYRDCLASVTIEDAKVCMRGAAALVSLANVSILLRTVGSGDQGRGGEPQARRSKARLCRVSGRWVSRAEMRLGTRHRGHLRGPGL
eukprot:scaffold54619_cov63-Phaeocystis_antarctica.AAC.6